MNRAHPIGNPQQNHYLPYPHANGFADGGRTLVVGHFNDQVFGLTRIDLTTGHTANLAEWPRSQSLGDLQWFDIASEKNILTAIADNAVWKLDLSERSPIAQLVYRETAGRLQALPSITSDASKIVVGRKLGDVYQAIELAPASAKEPRILTEFPWFANHYHFCPHNPEWIGFCHEGATDQVADRIWGRHETLAPLGQLLFDNGAAELCVGHERWAFHANVVYAVAYGVSPGGPRGIYEIRPETRRSRLISEGDRDWHVNSSIDGRWLVVDTTGPHDAPGRGWEGAGLRSDILLIDAKTGERAFLAESRYSSKMHLHPHPAFSPDGSTVYFNEASEDGLGCRVMSLKTLPV